VSDLQAKRDRAIVRSIRQAFRMAIKHAGKNAHVQVSDVLDLLDAFESGTMDDKLDPSTDSVAGPYYFPEGIQ
jgi:hypothetical protein